MSSSQLIHYYYVRTPRSCNYLIANCQLGYFFQVKRSVKRFYTLHRFIIVWKRGCIYKLNEAICCSNAFRVCGIIFQWGSLLLCVLITLCKSKVILQMRERHLQSEHSLKLSLVWSMCRLASLNLDKILRWYEGGSEFYLKEWGAWFFFFF